VLLPLVLIALSIAAAAGTAYGTQPQWAQYAHGLRCIELARQLQWPLVASAILPCLALAGLIISGKRRIWWLVGLTPVLVLFVHRFALDANHRYMVLENPALAPAGSVDFLDNDDWVVGLTLAGTPYAYPFAELYRNPVVLQSVHDKRFMILWSPFANRAVAVLIDHELKARELEVVGMPTNSLLLYDGRFGQFISGVTGQTVKDKRPFGFHGTLATVKMTWGQWKTAHPDTLVMRANENLQANAPLLPMFPLPPQNAPGAIGATRPATRAAPNDGTTAVTTAAPDKRIVFVAATQPVAMPMEAIGAAPLNVPGATNLVLWRDAGSGMIRAFDRRVNGDLFPQLARKSDPKKPDAWLLVDSDSGSTWVLSGSTLAAIDGPLKGEKMRAVETDDAVYWGIMKTWYPGLVYLVPTAHMQAGPPPAAPATRPAVRKPRRRNH